MTKNVRLVELVKISHELAFKFKDLYLDWVERENNQIADLFSRYASKPRLTSESKDVFRVFFDFQDINKLK